MLVEGELQMSAFALDALSAGLAVNLVSDLLNPLVSRAIDAIIGTAEERAIAEAYRYAYYNEPSESVCQFLAVPEVRSWLLAHAFTGQTPLPPAVRKLRQRLLFGPDVPRNFDEAMGRFMRNLTGKIREQAQKHESPLFNLVALANILVMSERLNQMPRQVIDEVEKEVASVTAETLSPIINQLREELRPPISERLPDYQAALEQYCQALPYFSLFDYARELPSLTDIYIHQQMDERQSEAQENRDPARQSRPATVMQALQNHRHLFIEGGPGMGKSTALRYLALTWAQGGVAPWTPVLVSASGLAARKVSLSQALCEQVSHELEKYLSHPLPEQIFEEPPPQNTAWLIFIDGLDEIVTLRERQDFLQALSTHLDHASYRFVITSRPLGLAERLSGEQVGYYIMRSFEPSDVATFAQQWFNGDDVEQFQSRLRESQLDVVARTPLLLTIAAILYQQAPHQPLARQRADFYEQCVTVLLEDEEIQRKRTGQDTSPRERFISDWLLRDPTGGDAAGRVWLWRRQLIERLALSLQQGDLGKLVERAVEVIRANGPGWGESLARRWHDSLAAGLLQRTGVVILHGNDSSFIHETFREYLAASALAQTYSPDNAEALPLVTRWRDDRWREVLLFLLGIWARGEFGPQAVTALVRQLWERRNRDVPPEEIIALLDFLLSMRSNGIRLEAAAIAAIAEEAAPTLMALTRARAEDFDKPTPTASTLGRRFGPMSVPQQAAVLLLLFGREQDALSVGQTP